MAKCQWCGKEMLDDSVVSCVENQGIQFPDGVWRQTVQFKAETEEWLVNWFRSLPKDRNLPNFDEWYKNHIASGKYKRCHCCNVYDGGFHHPGCYMERCPKCGGKLAGCECFIDDGGCDE